MIYKNIEIKPTMNGHIITATHNKRSEFSDVTVTWSSESDDQTVRLVRDILEEKPQPSDQ